MAPATTGVVGSGPISFPNADGAQVIVPLSAFEFSGSAVQVRSAWASIFDAAETRTLLALATGRAAAGELSAPPVPPPRPAIEFIAARNGPETDNIVVTAAPETSGGPLDTKIAFSVIETDTYAGLTSAGAAAMAIGVEAPSGKAGDPAAGTGLLMVKVGSVGTGSALPADKQAGNVSTTGYTVKADDTANSDLFTLLPQAGYTGSGGLSVKVARTDSTFTVTATYDSSKETGTQSKITVQTLGDLPGQVAFLVTAAAPPGGAAVPAGGSVQLTGAGPGLAATGRLYTP